MKKLFTLLLAVVASVGTMFAGGSVMIDGFAFHLNRTFLTAELVRSGNPYSGDIVIPESVVYNDTTYPVGSIEESAFYGYTEITSVSIPNSVIYISSTAFCGCSGLTSMTIPSSVREISGSAFSKCTNLKSINVAENNDYFSSVDGVLFNKNQTKIVSFPGGKQGVYTIPNNVICIGRYAFWGGSALISVIIPNSVTEIEQSAFNSCTGLTAITCEAVFPPYLERNVFYSVNKSIPLYVPEESIEAYKAADQWNEFMNILAIGTEGIEQISHESRAKSQKLIKDGQVFILQGDKIYTVTGQKL
jgi:hypothetical protein